MISIITYCLLALRIPTKGTWKEDSTPNVTVSLLPSGNCFLIHSKNGAVSKPTSHYYQYAAVCFESLSLMKMDGP